MKVLLVGNGAREHSLAWKLRQSPGLKELVIAPGNAGTADVGLNVPISSTDVNSLLRYARDQKIDLTVVGPEAPLALGIVDKFQDAGMLIFGPTMGAARIETSKSFAKELMLRYGVPTGNAMIFDDYFEASRYIQNLDVPIVIKADGLASGKGVTVEKTREKALIAIRRQMVEDQFDGAGKRVLIEEYMDGREMSVFAFVDGQRISSLVAACDYKKVGDKDTGLNTGGMGSYSPPQTMIWNDDVDRQVRSEIMEPIVSALSNEGIPYRGVLYAGLMFTDDGPKVIEFNCRLGDPETQVILPRLDSDLLEIMLRTAQGDLGNETLVFDPRACVGVVLVSGGYPNEYQTGFPIRGLNELDDDVHVFQAGTAKINGSGESVRVQTNGGRVLTVVALGDTLSEARASAYANIGRISFGNSFYRKDIALN